MASAADRLLDWSVVGGFTSAGYRLRSRNFAPTPDLAGHSVLVTGASSGLGAAACELLARAGATVHMVVRNPGKGAEIRARISERTGANTLRLWTCDVSDLGSVREFAAAFEAEALSLDALVHNAGVMPERRTHTSDGIELTFATNVAGPFLLTALMLPSLRREAATARQEASRVVAVASGGMYASKLDGDDLQLERREFDGTRFYAHTKRCQVLLTELWQERLAPLPGRIVSAHSTHPGWADTPGVQESLPGFRKVMRPLLRDERQGADTTAWLCWAPEPLAAPGRFWHDRRARPTHRVPWTRERPVDRERLWDECVCLSGWDGRL